MMVNQVNNNLNSWQSTVPQQMPWMTSYTPAATSLQFGQQQQLYPGNQNVQQMQPSLVSPPITTTTLTSPITTKPVSIASNALSTTSSRSPLGGVTVAMQPYPIPQDFINSPSETSSRSINNVTQTVPLVDSINAHSPADRSYPKVDNFMSSLTHIPTIPEEKFTHNKRSSIEMEDDSMMMEEPPTKQLLSENRLFKQFGSLHLDNESIIKLEDNNDDSGDENYIEDCTNRAPTINSSDRRDFNRYVYLLFKGKKNGENGTLHFGSSSSTIGRLARQERDKLSKAVILWNPPPKSIIFGGSSDEGSDDEDFTYRDHKDFLKNKPSDPDALTITEVFDDDACNMDTKMEPPSPDTDPDDAMLE